VPSSGTEAVLRRGFDIRREIVLRSVLLSIDSISVEGQVANSKSLPVPSPKL
jgi:hypothetical protein